MNFVNSLSNVFKRFIDDDIFVELSAAGDGSRASKTFNSATSNWASVGAALSALVSKGPGNATNGYTELKCC